MTGIIVHKNFLTVLFKAIMFSAVFAFFAAFSMAGRDWAFNFMLSFFLFFSISNGLGFLLSKIPVLWIEAPVQRLLIELLVITTYTAIVAGLIFIFTAIFYYNINLEEATQIIPWNFYYITIAITYLISFFLSGKTFLQNWKQSDIRAEKLKQLQIQSRYEGLKKQVNPHFLFNSLNVLSTLVYKDQDLAAKFVKQLSVVYRYVLETTDKPLVELATELEALKAYIFLLKIRFGEALDIQINLERVSGQMIPPLALQMLVENAVKHNIVSERKKLQITIAQENNAIVVKNNLQKRNAFEESVGVGLENIKGRYKHLTQKDVLVKTNINTFIVHLPEIRNYS